MAYNNLRFFKDTENDLIKRRKILGIKPGISLSVTGRLVNVDGKLTMYNPKYSIIAKGGEV